MIREHRTDRLDIQSSLRLATKTYRSGQLQKAEATCKQVLETAPNNAKALHLMALIYHKLGDKEAAKLLIGRSLSANPTYNDARYNLATMLKEEGKLKAAAAEYRRYYPTAGSIILFPSSLFHRTIPFHGDGERLCIAFDLLPTQNL